MTPNKTTSQPLTPGELLRLRRFSRLANEETDRARACYPYRLEDSDDPAVPMLTLFEELGKVVRANNKVGLAADEEVAEVLAAGASGAADHGAECAGSHLADVWRLGRQRRDAMDKASELIYASENKALQRLLLDEGIPPKRFHQIALNPKGELLFYDDFSDKMGPVFCNNLPSLKYRVKAHDADRSLWRWPMWFPHALMNMVKDKDAPDPWLYDLCKVEERIVRLLADHRGRE